MLPQEVKSVIKALLSENKVVKPNWDKLVNLLPENIAKHPDLEIYALITILVLVITTISLLFAAGNDDKKFKRVPKKYPDAPHALNKDEWIAFPLIEREEISHDVRRFRFGLQSKKHVVGLPIGQHIKLKYSYKDENGEMKECERSYTPTSSDDDLGFVDFVIKVYYKAPPKFPNGGMMSQHLDSLKIGDTMLMKGPKGEIDYYGRGCFTIKKLGSKETKPYKMKKIGMVAGGTGTLYLYKRPFLKKIYSTTIFTYATTNYTYRIFI